MNLKMSKSHKKIKIYYRNFIENQSDIYVIEILLTEWSDDKIDEIIELND